MKTKNLFTSILLILSITLSIYANKPIKSLLKGVKVVYVFDNKTHELTGIVLFEAINNEKREAILKKYENNSFFVGYLNGEFKEKNNEVLPVKGASIVIFKNVRFVPGDQFISGDQFVSGDKFAPEDQFIVYFDYEAWPSKWKGFSIENNKTQVVLKVL